MANLSVAGLRIRNFAVSLQQEQQNIRNGLRETLRDIGQAVEEEAKYGSAGQLFQDDTGTLRQSIQYRIWTGKGFGNSLSASVTVGPRAGNVRGGGSATIGKSGYDGEPLDVSVYGPIVHGGRSGIEASKTFMVWLSRRTGRVVFGRKIAPARPRPFMTQAWINKEAYADRALNDFADGIVNRIASRI